MQHGRREGGKALLATYTHKHGICPLQLTYNCDLHTLLNISSYSLEPASNTGVQHLARGTSAATSAHSLPTYGGDLNRSLSGSKPQATVMESIKQSTTELMLHKL